MEDSKAYDGAEDFEGVVDCHRFEGREIKNKIYVWKNKG